MQWSNEFPIDKLVIVKNGFGLPSQTYTLKFSARGGATAQEKALVAGLVSGGFWSADQGSEYKTASGKVEYDLSVFGDPDGNWGRGLYRSVWMSDHVHPGINRILKNVINYVVENGEKST